MGPSTALLASALSLWLSNLPADRASTEVLLAGGYSPDELAAAGVTSTEIQNAVGLLRTSGDTAAYNAAIAGHETANQNLSTWRAEYLRTRSDESAARLRAAKESRQQADAALNTAMANVKQTVESCITPESASKINRCIRASHLGLPVPCKFVDPSEVNPKELALAVREKNRAVRRGAAVDPEVSQTIGTATSGGDVRDAELNLDLLGDSLRLVYETNLNG